MRLRLGLLGDLHLVEDPSCSSGAWHNAYDFAGVPARIDRALARFEHARVDAIVLLGDLCHDGSRAALGPLAERLRNIPGPILAVAGNHDIGGRGALQETFGDSVTLVDPDGVRIAGALIVGVHVASGGWFAARLEDPPNVAAWPPEPVVVLSHFPLLSHANRLADLGLPYPGDILNRAHIQAQLMARPAPTIVLSGHIHTRDESAAGRALQLTQGALVEPPYECSIVEMTTDPVMSVRRTAIPGDGPPPSGALPALVNLTTKQCYQDEQWLPAS